MGNLPITATSVALLLLISFSVVGVINGQVVQSALSTSYYNTTCPRVSNIVDQIVYEAIKQSRNIVGGLLRLHFHDCFIRGCDASVLIDSISPHVAEKDGQGNVNSLRGFEVIDTIKSALEKDCPGVVSCADILALVARSSVYQIGGPSWYLPLGRRDGNTSNGVETLANLPSPYVLYSEMKDMFATKGLNEQDMVALSGAHTIGNTHCNVIESRLYNSTGPGGVDPNLDPTYAEQLKSECPFSNGKSTTIVPMDPTLGNDTFDSNYYSNVRANRGIFISDATLITDANGDKLVVRESSGSQYPFFSDFAQAMTKMANISVLLAPEGQVRQNCRVFNPPAPAPAPVPTASAPTPTISPTPVATSAPAPVPTASAPTPTISPTPVATYAAPVPAPSSPSPAPVPVAATSAQVLAQSSLSPAPGPVPTSPVPAPVGAPVPTSPVPAPVPTPPAPVPTSPAPAPVPIPPAPAPVPMSPGPAPISSSTSPAPISSSTAPTPVIS